MPTTDRIELTLRLVTPAFMGGALRGRVAPEGMRPPVIKSLLRYWWRTTQSGSLAEMLRREGDIFGSTDGTIGQRLRIVPLQDPKPLAGRFKPAGTEYQNGFYTYLAYGPVNWSRDKGYAESLIAETDQGYFCRFALHFQKSHRDEILKVLWLLSAFSGIGSRSRRGWGSLVVSGVDDGWRSTFQSGKQEMNPHTAASVVDLRKRLSQSLRAIVPTPPTNLTAHTAFGPSSAVIVGPSETSWTKAMEVLYKQLNNYRRLLGATRNHRRDEVGFDFDLRARWSARDGRPSALTEGSPSPLGAGFGLPLNGTHGSVGVGPKLNGRRASSLFFKVVKVATGYVPVVLWLPSMFLPSELDVFARVTDDDPGVRVAQPTASQGVHTFIHGGTMRRGEGAAVAGPASRREVWKGLKNETNWAAAWEAPQ